MNKTLRKLHKETDKYIDTLVLDFFKVKLFRGVIHGGDDFYYEYIGNMETNSSFCSCVGRLIPLIDGMKKEEYNYLATSWNYNNTLKAKLIK